jgi:hypothetical protein
MYSIDFYLINVINSLLNAFNISIYPPPPKMFS